MGCPGNIFWCLLTHWPRYLVPNCEGLMKMLVVNVMCWRWILKLFYIIQMTNLQCVYSTYCLKLLCWEWSVFDIFLFTPFQEDIGRDRVTWLEPYPAKTGAVEESSWNLSAVGKGLLAYFSSFSPWSVNSVPVSHCFYIYRLISCDDDDDGNCHHQLSLLHWLIVGLLSEHFLNINV